MWPNTAEQAGHEKGLEEGLKQGIEQGIRQVARNMLAAGIPLETVMQATGPNRAALDRLA